MSHIQRSFFDIKSTSFLTNFGLIKPKMLCSLEEREGEDHKTCNFAQNPVFKWMKYVANSDPALQNTQLWS